MSGTKVRRGRLHSQVPAIGVALLITAFFAVAVCLFHEYADAPFGRLTSDPNAIFCQPAYYGMLSQAGILMWSSVVAICLFCFSVLTACRREHALRQLFLWSGLLTGVLMLDDTYLLHESLTASLDVPEVLVLACYLVLVIPYVAKFRSLLRKTETLLLAMSFLFFTGSIILDVVGWPPSEPFLYEDLAKIAGIAFWLMYFARLGYATIVSCLREPSNEIGAVPCEH